MHTAAGNNSAVITELLIRAGSDVNAEDNVSTTLDQKYVEMIITSATYLLKSILVYCMLLNDCLDVM